MSNIRGIPGEIPVDGNIYKGKETASTTTHVNNFTKEISVNVKEDYINGKLDGKQDKLIAGEGIEINENNKISVKRAEDTLDITSEDITVEDDKLVFNSNIAHEIMSMDKRLRADASVIDPTVAQGAFIGLFTPRSIIKYSLPQGDAIVYEYSTTNWLLDTYRTTYVEFIWDATTEKLYLDADHPTNYEDHIVGFSTEGTGGISLTTNADLRTSRINTLHINDLDTVSIYDQPSLLFNANANNELESIEFMQNGYSADFTYTVPKGAKHYVVNELPTTNIDITGNYYVMTESEDARGYLSTDIHNLTTTEYPSSTTGALRQDATVNSSDYVKLNTSRVSSGDYMGDIAIKFNIPCTVTVSVNPRQTRLAFMYIDVNGVNVKLVNAGETYTYTRVFGVNETLCIRGASFSTDQFYYKLAIQPYTIDGKIPLSTNVDEYINFENLWFKNGSSSGSGTEAHLYAHYINMQMSGAVHINLVIYSNDNTQFTYSTILSWLVNNGFRYTDDNFYTAAGYYDSGRIVLGLAPSSGGYFKVSYEYIENGTLKHNMGDALADAFNVTDTVKQIF